jgi:uncharacterized protein YjbJ (UPF0337 family)
LPSSSLLPAEGLSLKKVSKMSTANKDQIKGKLNVVKGSLKKGVGELIGNPRLKVEGTADKIKGRLQVGLGNVKQAIKSETK